MMILFVFCAQQQSGFIAPPTSQPQNKTTTQWQQKLYDISQALNRIGEKLQEIANELERIRLVLIDIEGKLKDLQQKLQEQGAEHTEPQKDLSAHQTKELVPITLDTRSTFSLQDFFSNEEYPINPTDSPVHGDDFIGGAPGPNDSWFSIKKDGTFYFTFQAGTQYEADMTQTFRPYDIDGKFNLVSDDKMLRYEWNNDGISTYQRPTGETWNIKKPDDGWQQKNKLRKELIIKAQQDADQQRQQAVALKKQQEAELKKRQEAELKKRQEEDFKKQQEEDQRKIEAEKQSIEVPDEATQKMVGFWKQFMTDNKSLPLPDKKDLEATFRCVIDDIDLMRPLHIYGHKMGTEDLFLIFKYSMLFALAERKVFPTVQTKYKQLTKETGSPQAFSFYYKEILDKLAQDPTIKALGSQYERTKVWLEKASTLYGIKENILTEDTAQDKAWNGMSDQQREFWKVRAKDWLESFGDCIGPIDRFNQLLIKILVDYLNTLNPAINGYIERVIKQGGMQNLSFKPLDAGQETLSIARQEEGKYTKKPQETVWKDDQYTWSYGVPTKLDDPKREFWKYKDAVSEKYKSIKDTELYPGSLLPPIDDFFPPELLVR